MDLWKEILIRSLQSEKTDIEFTNFNINAREIVEMRCYLALQKIKAIIDDDSLLDKECFKQIEEIVCVLEDIGSGGGTRYDFG